MKKKQKVLLCAVGGDDQLYVLTSELMDKYLDIFYALQEEDLTWREYKKLLDDDKWFDYIYESWLDCIDFGENFQDLVDKIQKGVDVSKEKNYNEIECNPILLDDPMPDPMVFYDYSIAIGNDPGEYLSDSLPEEILREYSVEATCGGPGCASGVDYLDYERKDEIIKELESRGFQVKEVRMLPF